MRHVSWHGSWYHGRGHDMGVNTCHVFWHGWWHVSHVLAQMVACVTCLGLGHGMCHEMSDDTCHVP